MENVWMASIVILAVAILGLLAKTVVLTLMTAVQIHAKIMEPVKMVLMILYVHVLIHMLGRLVKGDRFVHLNKTTVQTMASVTQHLLRALLESSVSAFLDTLVQHASLKLTSVLAIHACTMEPALI
jgi:hypothetical protein